MPAPACRFRYLRDPVFLAAAFLYLLNRFVAKPLTIHHPGFCHWWANSLLCIPFCLPPCLLLYRWVRLRNHDGMPTRAELLIHLVAWSFWFKWLAPRIGGPFAWVRPDPWDVAFYALGAAIAGAFWGAWGWPRQRNRGTV